MSYIQWKKLTAPLSAINLNSRQLRKPEDIQKISEIIRNFIYWQEFVRRESVKLGTILEHIINFAEVQRISIYR